MLTSVLRTAVTQEDTGSSHLRDQVLLCFANWKLFLIDSETVQKRLGNNLEIRNNPETIRKQFGNDPEMIQKQFINY